MQTFQVEKTDAPAKWAFWQLPIGWVKLTDAEGNSAIGAVMKDGVIQSDCLTGSMGPAVTPRDCAETCAAALALFAAA